MAGKDPTGLLNQEAWRELCPLNDWGQVLAAATPDEQLAERLRQATRTGRPLGRSEFISALEAHLTDWCVERSVAHYSPRGDCQQFLSMLLGKWRKC